MALTEGEREDCHLIIHSHAVVSVTILESAGWVLIDELVKKRDKA